MGLEGGTFSLLFLSQCIPCQVRSISSNLEIRTCEDLKRCWEGLEIILEEHSVV